MNHDDIWRALDTLAAENGLSASGLARKARLDPTTLNPSKRRTIDGRPRWPTTESLAKILDATNITLADFGALVAGARAVTEAISARLSARRVPLIALELSGTRDFLDGDGSPAGAGWAQFDLPEMSDPKAYACRIIGDGLAPAFRDGGFIVVSPAAPIREGDRVLICFTTEEVVAKQLAKRLADRLDFQGLNSTAPDETVASSDVVWIHRIIYASQ